MNPLACIFDLDGVIVDTARFHYTAWRRLANALGFDFTEAQNEQLKGVSRKESLEILLDWGGKVLEEAEKQKWLDLKNSWYLELVDSMDKGSVLPGTREFVEAVKSAGYRTALGSASKNALTILEKVGMSGIFEVVVDGNKTTRSKPDPQVFLRCAEELGVESRFCVVFEDAEAGIEAAGRAGMYAIGIGDAAVLKNADLVIPGLFAMSVDRLPFKTD